MGTPNFFNTTKWRLEFSNIPTITNLNNMKLYNDYVRNCTIPEFALDNDYSNYGTVIYKRPITKVNENLGNLDIEFKCSEDLENYTNLFQYIQYLKYGEDLPEDVIVDNVIKNISIVILDNQNRDKKIIYFTNVYLSSISSLNLLYGEEIEVTFTASFFFQEMKIKDPQA